MARPARRRSRCRRAGIDPEDDHGPRSSRLRHLGDVDVEVGPDLLHVVELLQRLEQLEQRLRVLPSTCTVFFGTIASSASCTRSPSPPAPLFTRAARSARSRRRTDRRPARSLRRRRRAQPPSSRPPRTSWRRRRSGPSARTSTPPSSARRGCRRRARLVAHLGDGARRVVGDRVDQQRDAAGAVALVHHFLIVDALELTGALLDRALDVLLRHRAAARCRSRCASRGLPPGSPPPSLAAMVISRMSFVNSAPRFASVAAL